ncbi:hypothetical protein PPL_09877 [Heterostelium album PN500]|uniref:Uncharacterized protein n=1 Tax=Heterostelium pallidum (strain ATCC 26659 / Pp 5 / PN500) TaxID=670386 RepID=D3BPB2_HETP5|nr:hypothetical protein PPL_09877 [Heterostelium album PN500]EFA77122.1 hypothetical protein PPL_09877 [Heterostelium album PN500]|eukprot:XP_020429251.1 hypothetical protein PPL_09877 [Heterostelium album PN500]
MSSISSNSSGGGNNNNNNSNSNGVQQQQTATSSPASAAATVQQQQQQLIKTSIVSGKLEIDDVVLKDTYVLRNLKVQSQVDYPLTVSLRSDLAQIAFQSTNENLQDTETEVPVQDDDFNQLFNEVNVIDQLELLPLQTKNIVMSFRPSLLLSDHQLLHQNQSDPTTGNNVGFNNYFEVKGKIFFSCNPTTTITATDNNQDKQQQQQQQQLVVDVVTRICRSQIKVDLNEIIFDDCIVGSSYIKDLTIWNRSEMPLVFSIYCKEKIISLFQFTDVTGLPLATENQVVPSYSSMSMRIVFKPNAAGQSTYKFKLENKNDSSNYELIVIHSTVTSEQQTELIQVSTNSFDMGDCYSDEPTYGTFTVKNISEDAVEINFSSDLVDEVSFMLHEEEVESTSSSGSKKKKKLENMAIGDHRDAEQQQQQEKDAAYHGRSSRTHQESNEVIDELTLNPGSERVIQIKYCPKSLFSLASDPRALRLNNKTFRLLLKCPVVSVLHSFRFHRR